MSLGSNLTPRLDVCLDSWAQRSGDDLALAWQSGTWTYADLARESQKRAVALHAFGVRPGTHVGLLQPNRPEWLACAFGVWRLGAILVPINTLYQSAELQYALRHADVEVLISAVEFLRHDYREKARQLCPRLFGGADRDDLPKLRAALFSGDATLPCDTNWDAAVARSDCAKRPDAPPNKSTDAAIFFTSGSTASPKGVVHTHTSMIRGAENVGRRLGLTPEDRTYGYLPLFFNGGLVGVALATLNRGGAVLLQEVFSPGEAIELMERHHCSVFFGWPHQAETIARHPSFDRHRLNLRKGPGANASWASAILSHDHECVGAWGMSETGPMAACSHHTDAIETRRSSHGRAMPGLEIRIFDEANRSLPADTVGEIAVRGDSLMRTYYGSTARDCFDADGFFHTGDEGRLDGSGSLTFLGRMRDVIKTAGVNVAAAEVEQILIEHPQVASAYVVPVPHPSRGENVAAFVVASGSHLDLGDVTRHCRERLASYKVPRHLFRIEAGELPTLGSGKVDRRQLRGKAAELAVRKESDPE